MKCGCAPNKQFKPVAIAPSDVPLNWVLGVKIKRLTKIRDLDVYSASSDQLLECTEFTFETGRFGVLLCLEKDHPNDDVLAREGLNKSRIVA